MEENKTENIVDDIVKTHISFSEFSLFSECGHRHLIEKYLKLEEQPPSIHLIYGNSMHYAIEMTLKDNLSVEDSARTFRETFQKGMFEQMKDLPEYNEMEEYTLQGENTLRVIDLKSLLKDYDVYSVEENLYEELAVFGKKGYYFKGFIDLVVKHKVTGEILIIDWKTATEPWKISSKLSNDIFMCQMRFYKYFWGRKNNIPMSNIKCRYVVLARLKNKKKPENGYGNVALVDIDSTEDEIKFSLEKLASAIKQIHIVKSFPKVKHFKNEKFSCMFCSYKGGKHPLCNYSLDQDKELLKIYLKA